MKVIGSLLLAAAAVSAIDLDSKYIDVKTKWDLFKTEFEKSYTIGEDALRMQNFIATERRIVDHNAKGLSWTLGHNQFSDLTPEEFAGLQGTRPAPRAKNFVKLPDIDAAGATKDWVADGAVTPIKDQGQCGSCWAFSAVGSIEGAYAVSTGKLMSFSEQDLVSCDTKGSDAGCNGGLMDNAFGFVESKGLCTEADYPYVSGTGRAPQCKTACSPAVTVGGYVDVANEAGMIAAIDIGPVSVAVEADKSAWQSYKSGVLDTSACGTNLDHGVLAVGYGTDGKDYYTIKNSWGTSWGEHGYIRLVRGKNQCGVASAASYPTGVGPAASKVTLMA